MDDVATPTAREQLFHRLVRLVEAIYPDVDAAQLSQRLVDATAIEHIERPPKPANKWDEAEVLLISYGNSLVREGEAGVVKRVLGWFSGDEEAVFTAGRVHDFEKFIDHPRAPVILENCRQALEGVRVRCFPLYRPIIDQYQTAVERLMKGDKGGVEELLAEGDELRGQIRSVMTRAKDFMNYYEATQVGERSGDFKGYHELLDQMRSQKPKPRGDQISTHLDELEREFK